MAEKKITRVDALDAAIAALEGMENGEPYIEPLRKMRESLCKSRSERPAGPSKTQQENMALLARVVELLADSEDGMAAGDFVGRIQFVTTPQKATAVLRLGIKTGEVVAEKEGKRTVYRLA